MSQLLAFLPPQASVEFASFSDDVKADIKAKLALLAPILAMARGHTTACRQVAAQMGVSFSTAWRWFEAARRGDLHQLADKRRDAKLWQTEHTLLPAADIATFRAYALKNQRKVAPAVRDMHRDWRSGKLTTTQPVDPRTGLPEGWSVNNLRKHAPSAYELTASRQGRAAASVHRPKVITTRVGLRCGQYYVGDDVWHDHLVDYPGQRTPVRPLEADVLDLASACLVHHGLRPRLKRADGSRENLTEREVRWIVAATLRDRGYRTDELGTTWLIEHGTFTIRDELARTLWDHFRIRIEMSSIMADVPWLGSFGGKGGGNPRFKAALESFHNLRHNELAALPGQVGKDRDHTPEEHKALVRYAEQIGAAAERLALVAPGYADKLRRPVMLYSDFADINDKKVAIINDRRDHHLEGWAEAGHKVVQYLLGEQLLDEAAFLALPVPPGTDVFTWGRTLAEQGHTRSRLKSPAEVWRAGRGELSRLPAHGISLILGPELAREQRVEAGEFIWRDAELGTLSEWRYFAEITGPNGRRELLADGETYLVHPNPFAYDELCVSDAKGRFMGVARRHDRICRADTAGMQEEFKRIKHHEAELQAELARKAAPLSAERVDLRRHNAEVLDQALGKPAERAQHRADSALVRRVNRQAGDITPADREDFLSASMPSPAAEHDDTPRSTEKLSDYL